MNNPIGVLFRRIGIACLVIIFSTALALVLIEAGKFAAATRGF